MTISAQAVVDRIRRDGRLGGRNADGDAFLAGPPDTEAKGIVTTSPSTSRIRAESDEPWV